MAALDHRGVASAGTDGISLWLDVRDEQSALLTLASRGVGAAPGTPFLVSGSPNGSDHLRLTCGLVEGALGGALHLGCMRMAPSRRMTSPFM